MPTPSRNKEERKHVVQSISSKRARSIGLVLLATVTILVVGAGPAWSARSATVKPVAITVKAGEFYFTLTKTSIPKPETVAFTVINEGTITHDFSIPSLNKTTKMLAPHQKQVLTVTFKKKGSFYYECLVPRHAQEGMAGSFTVK
jgi:uncharacterized cupredoxin-like copper-binding protein